MMAEQLKVKLGDAFGEPAMRSIDLHGSGHTQNGGWAFALFVLFAGGVFFYRKDEEGKDDWN
jgi:hypothetical protein